MSLKDISDLGSGERILVVEDEPSLRKVLSNLLKWLGYETVSAADGQEAMQLLQDDATIELLLTDICMPGGMSGFELAAEARAQRASLPLVYMSGYSVFPADLSCLIPAPMIRKPCTPENLAQTLAGALAGETARSGPDTDGRHAMKA